MNFADFSNSSDSSDAPMFSRVDPVPSLICQGVIYAIVCLIGLVGNTLLIYVVLRFSKMQTVTNMYIVNLAIADECFLIGIPFLIVYIIKQDWIFGNLICKAYMILMSLNPFTSSLFLFIMSTDQYIAVCHPILAPRWRTPFISRVVSMLAWMCCILLMIPTLLYSNEVAVYDTRMVCVTSWGTKFTFAFMVFTFVFNWGIPLTLILVFCCLVIPKLGKNRSHRQVTNMVLTLVKVHVLCWTPYWITAIALYVQDEPNSLLLTISVLASCLCYSNSAMNPILYAFLSDNLKKDFMKAFTYAAGNEINATPHLESSAPKKKHGSAGTVSSIPNNDDECYLEPLVSNGDSSTSAIAMTSRSINIGGDKQSTPPKDTVVKNGLTITFSANL